MATPVQQIPNGTIPIMSGGVAGTPVQQQTLVYQQQPVIVAGAAPMAYTPRKPYVRHPNEEHCKIFVGGVGKGTTEDSLRAYFSSFGEIADSVIMKDKHTNEPRGFAFVTFKNPESVSAVIEKSNKGGHTLDGKMFLQVRKYFPKSEYDPEKANIALNAANGAQPNFQYKGPMKVNPELKIFVGGIGIGTTEDDVKKYFGNFGKVLAVDMPLHHVYKCPKGFAFVGFETFDSVAAVTKDRYHQINGKTVEVKGSDEQQAHLNKKKAEGMAYRMAAGRGAGRGIQTGNIATVSGYGAYAGLAQPQVIVNPQPGVAQYAAVPAATGGYVYDPSSNTYYQLPGTVVAGGAVAAAGQTVGATSVAAATPYAGMTMVGAAGQQVLTSPQVGQRQISADMLQTLTAAAGSTVAIGTGYPNETSTFGPTRHNVIGAGTQQPMAGNTVADPHVVYSTATSISAGDAAALSTRGGFHPYGR